MVTYCMEPNQILNLILKETRTRFELLMSICQSPIEKIFVAKLYSYFYTRRFPIDFLAYDAQTLLILEQMNKDGSNAVYVNATQNYDPNHAFYKIDREKGFYNDPLTGILERLSGFKITGITVNYLIFPQLPVYDNQRLVYTDFAIIIKDKAGVTLGKFAIECDGFDWHHTKEQLTKDNKRNRFLTHHGYKIIRFTGSEIMSLDDRAIVILENTMYHSIFNDESDIYKWETY